MNREQGGRGGGGHGRRLTVIRGDVARLASARVSVSEACNDDGRADTANQSAHYTDSIDVDPDIGRPLDNRRVASHSPLLSSGLSENSLCASLPGSNLSPLVTARRVYFQTKISAS